MKKGILAAVLGLSVLACPLLYFTVGPVLEPAQVKVLKTILIIMGCSGLFCFVVGELTNNNSQMDKLWSILPVVYVWVIAAGGGFTPRLLVMAVLVTLWGMRLTFNFGRKGPTAGSSGLARKIIAGRCCAQRKSSSPIGNGCFSTFFSSVSTRMRWC